MNEQWIIYGIVFAAVFLPIVCWRREVQIDRSIPVADWNRLPGIFKALWKPSYVFETSFGSLFATVFSGRARRYSEQCEVAGLPISPEKVFVCKMIMAILFGLMGAATFLLPSAPQGVAEAATVILLAFGWILPSMTIDSAAQKRQEEIVRSLPFAIDLIGAAMRAGLEFGAAMRYYTGLRDGGALTEEFTRVLRDASLGLPVTESLQHMANRVRIKTFTAFVSVVTYGTEIGASIADTLKLHGAEMRRERFALAEQKAARAPALMIFPIAVFILPAVFLIIFVPVLLQFMETQAM